MEFFACGHGGRVGGHGGEDGLCDGIVGGCGLTTDLGWRDGIFGDGFYGALGLFGAESEAEGVVCGEALDEVERNSSKGRYWYLGFYLHSLVLGLSPLEPAPVVRRLVRRACVHAQAVVDQTVDHTHQGSG